MNKKLLILALVVAAIGLGFILQDSLPQLFNTAVEGLQEFKKSEFGQTVQEIGSKIFNPPPLNIGGGSNSANLGAPGIVAETNLQRRANGNLPPLVENEKLTAAAKAKAEDMFAKQYFEHVSPDGTDPATLVKNAGYNYISTGENLILGNFKDEKEVVQLWMDSPGHRENILNTRFTEIGVAMVKGTYNGRTAWIGVQEFGLPASACAQVDATMKATIEANKNELEVLGGKVEAKKAEIQATNQRSDKYNQLVNEYNALVIQYNALSNATAVLVAKYNVQVTAFNKCVNGEFHGK